MSPSEIFNSEEENMDFYVQLFTDACKTGICRWLIDQPDLTPEKFVQMVHHGVVCIAHCIIKDEKQENQ